MNIFERVGNEVIKVAGKASKYSPEMLIGSGIILGGVTVFLACKATLHLEDTLEEADNKLCEARETGSRKELTKAYISSVGKVGKLYAPAATTGLVSVACILTGHNILKQRELAIAAAYKVLDDSYSGYRKRVAEKYGEEIEKKIRYGVEEKEFEITEETKDGKTKTKKVKKEVISHDEPSAYAKVFDSGSIYWEKNPEQNLYFLKTRQNYFTQILQSRGHVFLNEVYDDLGLPRTEAGCVVGWVLGAGDDYVDFGLYNIEREATRDFINGYEPVILLDFNVDGVISHMI